MDKHYSITLNINIMEDNKNSSQGQDSEISSQNPKFSQVADTGTGGGQADANQEKGTVKPVPSEDDEKSTL